ncbi:hypothetical protein T492DRAFT_1058988, partial [Pavlovales sp. CCMP2436]
MRKGEGNAEAFSSLQECLSVGKQLERTFAKRAGRGGGSGTASNLAITYDKAGNPVQRETGSGGSENAGRRSEPSDSFSYQVYEVTGDALLVRGSYPKQVNAAGVKVRASAESARSTRDPLKQEGLEDSWRELFESYSSEIDDEWLKFRESLFEVGGSRLVVEPGPGGSQGDGSKPDDEPVDEDPSDTKAG